MLVCQCWVLKDLNLTKTCKRQTGTKYSIYLMNWWYIVDVFYCTLPFPVTSSHLKFYSDSHSVSKGRFWPILVWISEGDTILTVKKDFKRTQFLFWHHITVTRSWATYWERALICKYISCTELTSNKKIRANYQQEHINSNVIIQISKEMRRQNGAHKPQKQPATAEKQINPWVYL